LSYHLSPHSSIWLPVLLDICHRQRLVARRPREKARTSTPLAVRMDAEVDWGMEDDFDPWQAGSASLPKNEQPREVKEEERQSVVPVPQKAIEKPSQSRCSLLRAKLAILTRVRIGISEEEQEIQIEKRDEQIRTASRDSSVIRAAVS
jgi:hypothetical protein